MTRAQTKQAESDAALVQDTDELLVYTGTLTGRPAYIYYHFNAADELVSGSYHIDSTDDVDDVAAYIELQEMLAAKYGAPDDRGVEWRMPTRARQLRNLAEAAKAVATGEATFRTCWRRDEVDVMMYLMEDTEKYNAILFVFYYDPAVEVNEQSRRRQQDFDMI